MFGKFVGKQKHERCACSRKDVEGNGQESVAKFRREVQYALCRDEGDANERN